MPDPVLHHRSVLPEDTGPAAWLLVLHGIYGSGRNWASVIRRVVQERGEWGGLLVDLRQHGESRGFEAPHTLEACAEDLRRLIRSEELEGRALLGHSFGGKVALVYARDPEPGLEEIWIVDSSPDAGEPSGAAWGVLEVLRNNPGPFLGRDHGVEALVADGVDRPVARWMATNLEEGVDGAFRWRIDPDDMEELLRDFFRVDAWDVVEDPPEGVEIHVVKAEDSGVLGEDACARIEAAGRETGRVRLHRIEGGHWLNADNPDGLVELLVAELEAG